jgi:hypothetical protein
LPITPINFNDAPPGWRPGDPLPTGATPVDAAGLEGIQSHVGAYVDSVVASVSGLGSGVILSNVFNGTTWPTRPASGIVLWIGGGAVDDPTTLMNNNDIWFPSQGI